MRSNLEGRVEDCAVLLERFKEEKLKAGRCEFHDECLLVTSLIAKYVFMRRFVITATMIDDDDAISF